MDDFTGEGRGERSEHFGMIMSKKQALKRNNTYQVKILDIDPDKFEDRLRGKILLIDGLLQADPPQERLLQNILIQPILVMVFEEGGSERKVFPDKEPHLWLKYLHRELKSPYLRATQMEPLVS